MSNDIKKLPASLVTKIAAGQVVERPASVVKELLENALDANATKISVSITSSGMKEILVTDDGHGMSKRNLERSYLSHTTSKISSASDLDALSTLGFRGEALASIASFATLTISSREKSKKVGNTLTVSKNKIVSESKIGMAQGTKVLVRSLFANTPGRKKNLKGPQVELSHIISLITMYALAYPEVEIRLTNNEKEILYYPASSRDQRLKIVFGKETYKLLTPLQSKTPHIKIDGYIGSPQLAHTGAGHSYVVVNKRPVKIKEIAQVVKSSYKTLIPGKYQPTYFLSITLPFSLVDANIDPQKERIRFIHEKEIFALLTKTLEKVFKDADNALSFSFSGFDKSLARKIKHSDKAWDVKKTVLSGSSQIISFDDVYLFLATEQGVLLVDQHAAHERILYNQYLAHFERLSKKTYVLEIPIIISLGASDYALLTENASLLKKLGVLFEKNDKKSIKIVSLPEVFKDTPTHQFIHEMIGRIKETSVGELKETIAYLACRSAIKEGDALTKKEATRLIKKLVKEENYSSCPHGRPTLITLTRSELDVLFKRI